MRLLLLLTSIDALRYSVVLPSSKRLHKDAVRALQPVSYTHLTLPTKA